MIGEHIVFDNLMKIGRELAIPNRYWKWANGEPATTGRKGATAKKPGRVLIELFGEIPFAANEALVGVYELTSGAPLPPPTKLGDQSIEASRRVVVCIEHPVHWAMVESRARDQRYGLTRLFAVDVVRVAASGEQIVDQHAIKHFRPAANYHEVPEHDVRLIEEQVAPAQRPHVPAPAKTTEQKGAQP